MEESIQNYFPHYFKMHYKIFTKVMFTLNESTITNVFKDKKTKKIMEKIVKLDDQMRDTFDLILDTVNDFQFTPMHL
jgi:hypothetical protein